MRKMAMVALATAACSTAAPVSNDSGATTMDGGVAADTSMPMPDAGPADTGTDSGPAPRRVIVFVWDGLRNDSVNSVDTPNLYALSKRGVRFSDNHSTYPTFTMMNASSFATGGFPATTGFYGNTVYAPGPTGKDSNGLTANFAQPAFLEDWALLADLDQFYGGKLVLVGTLFQAAQKAGLKTATIGKTGAAFLQDYTRGGLILDERHAWPQTLATGLQLAGFPLPKATPGISLPSTDGRPLREALVAGGATESDYKVAAKLAKPKSDATNLVMKLPTSPTGADVDNGKTTYTIELRTKELTLMGKTWTYFDSAKAIRQ